MSRGDQNAAGQGGVTVNCLGCGTALPSGALFCGECGSGVVPPEPNRPRPTSMSSQTVAIGDDDNGFDDKTEDESDVEVRVEQLRCEQCDAIVAEDDIFCGECGLVSRSITNAFRSASSSKEARGLDQESARLPADEPGSQASPEPEVATESDIGAAPDVVAEPLPDLDELAISASSGPRLPPLRSFAPPSGLTLSRAAPFRSASVRSGPPLLSRASRTPSFLSEGDDDVEATRIVTRTSSNRFVLQFSTGESVTVHGTGLVGRNPHSEPGEYFDQLIRVFDSGKSVSKTHLEFGQADDSFWVSDRYSGNGTVLREPEAVARRAEPGRRYRVVRGTRIDIGEQFFVVC